MIEKAPSTSTSTKPEQQVGPSDTQLDESFSVRRPATTQSTPTPREPMVISVTPWDTAQDFMNK